MTEECFGFIHRTTMDKGSELEMILSGKHPKFQNVTVEEAIRSFGEDAKARIACEGERVIKDINVKLQEKVDLMKSRG